MEFTIQTLLLLVLIGLVAGVLSGIVGVGGGIIIVPALVFIFGLSQLQAQGTSLAVLLLPVGIFAVMNYYKAGNINITAALVIAGTFVIGAHYGSKFALKLPEYKIKFIFGLFILYVAIRMIYSSGTKWFFS